MHYIQGTFSYLRGQSIISCKLWAPWPALRFCFPWLHDPSYIWVNPLYLLLERKLYSRCMRLKSLLLPLATIYTFSSGEIFFILSHPAFLTLSHASTNLSQLYSIDNNNSRAKFSAQEKKFISKSTKEFSFHSNIYRAHVICIRFTSTLEAYIVWRQTV